MHYSTCTRHTSRLSALWNICWKRFDFDLFGRVKASGLGVLLVVCKTTKVTCGLSSNASSKWSLSISGMMMDGCENGNTVQTMWPTREDFSNKKKNRREITASDAGDRIIDLQLTQKAVPQCFGKNGAIWLVKNVYEVCRQFNILYDRYFGSVVDLTVIAKWPSINTPPPHTHTHTMWQISLSGSVTLKHWCSWLKRTKKQENQYLLCLLFIWTHMHWTCRYNDSWSCDG